MLARDRMGIKPLYYARLPDGGIAFASEISALLAHGDLRADLSPDGLASFFFSDYVHPPDTIVRGVHKLPPGHTLVWRDGVLGAPRAFWRVPPPAPAPRADDRTLAAELWSGLGRAVKDQLVSDVPVGIFLSGGIDSSIVARLAAAAGGHMKAFSIGFEDATFDESKHARLMAEHLDVDFISETLHERNLIDTLDPALDKLDEPMADPSFLPTYLLSELASRYVKVVVGGDGGDELWGGYPTYRAHRYAQLYARFPRFVREGIIRKLVERLPVDHRYQSLEWKLKRFTGRWDDDPSVRHLRWMSSVDIPDLIRALPGGRDLRPSTFGCLCLPPTISCNECWRSISRPTCPARCWPKSTALPWRTGWRSARPCSTTRWSTGHSRCRRATRCAAPREVLAEAGGARAHPRSDHRPAQERVRHSARLVATRTTPAPPGRGGFALAALEHRPARPRGLPNVERGTSELAAGRQQAVVGFIGARSLVPAPSRRGCYGVGIRANIELAIRVMRRSPSQTFDQRLSGSGAAWSGMVTPTSSPVAGERSPAWKAWASLCR